MASARDTLKWLTGWARTSRVSADTGRFPIQQISYLGRLANCVMLYPYGYHANPPADVLVYRLSSQGRPEARVGLPVSPKDRPMGGDPGEVFVFHPPTGSVIHFKSSGDIEIDTDTELTITTPLMTISGNVEIAGDLDVTGDVGVTGATALGATVTSNSKDISDTHAHGGSPTAPLGAVTPTGVPV